MHTSHVLEDGQFDAGDRICSRLRFRSNIAILQAVSDVLILKEVLEASEAIQAGVLKDASLRNLSSSVLSNVEFRNKRPAIHCGPEHFIHANRLKSLANGIGMIE